MWFSIKITEIQENLANLFVKSYENIYNNNMKKFLMIILSFIFLGGAVSSSTFYISNSINAVEHETNGGGNSQPLKMKI